MFLRFTTPAARAFSHLISAALADSAYDAAKESDRGTVLLTTLKSCQQNRPPVTKRLPRDSKKGCPAAAFREPYSVLSIHISIHITPSSKYYKTFGYPGEELAPSAAAHGTPGLQIHFDQHIGSTVALWFVYPDIQRFAPSVIL